jgi:Tfp pilus assembly protein PilX
MRGHASLFCTRIRAGRQGSGASRRSRKQGVALITTLLLLILLSLLGLTMAVTANSDMLINSYYGSYRGSFYAADSGLNIARASMINQIKGAVNTTACAAWGAGAATGCTSAPLTGTTAASTAQTYITSSPYNAFGSLNAGQATNSWPANFMIPSSMTGCSTSVAFPTSGITPNPQILTTNSSGQPTSYAYTFSYTLCALGRAQALQQVATKEIGTLTITVTAQSAPGTPKNVTFADFGLFIDNFPECNGALVQGTITGPMFTNGSWNFGTGTTGYNFTDPVGQNDPNASFIFGGHCDPKNASSDTYSGQTIAPTFQMGFNRNQPKAPLPPNDYSQKWAVIDGVGCGEGGSTCGSSSPPNPTNSNLNAGLKNISGTSYPTGGATSGVYIPYCTGGAGCTTPDTILGGGFYVEESAGVTTNIQMSLNTVAGNPVQIYTITQNSTATTITLNINANTTTVVSGSTTLTLAGVPTNRSGATPREGAIIYVNGKINSLSGPGQGVASIQDYYGTTIAANGDINVTGDLIYKHEPVQPNTDALINGNDYNQVLGLFTNNGNIVLSVPGSYSPQNLETDAVVAAINASCPGGSSSCGMGTSGSFNTWTIVGGRIESNVHSVGYSTRNTWYDKRFTTRNDGFAPPFFPSTTVPANDTVSATAPKVLPTTQRLTWVTWPQ